MNEPRKDLDIGIEYANLWHIYQELCFKTCKTLVTLCDKINNFSNRFVFSANGIRERVYHGGIAFSKVNQEEQDTNED